MGTSGQSITLANSIIGVGVLAMPFCFQQCGVILATLILLFMGLVSRLCCYFLLKSAIIARRRNFEFLAHHVFGPAGKLAVEVGIIGYLMGTCIAYFVVVGDLGPQIVSKMLNINQSDWLRTSIMLIVTLLCVLPLGLLRNVDSLSNVSAATIGFYFCLVMKVISEAAWAGRGAGGGAGAARLWRPAGLLQCVPIFSMALFCQTQLFEIFDSMPSLSLEKMNLVTKNAINICAGVYFTLGLAGYLAFGDQGISGNVLVNLSPTMASDVIKLGFVMSLAVSFPLIIFPCRASLYSFLYRKVHHHDHIVNHSIPPATFRCMTVGIVGVSLGISLLVPNIELVLGLVGSTIGVLVCVIFPAACFVNLTFKNTTERVLAKLTIVLGLVILVLGSTATLWARGGTGAGRHNDLNYSPENIDRIVEDFFEARRHGEGRDVVDKPEVKEEIKVPETIVNHEQVKDSEAQPPNPVPPEVEKEEKALKPPKLDSKVDKPVEINVEKPADSGDLQKIEPKLNPPEIVKPKLDVQQPDRDSSLNEVVERPKEKPENAVKQKEKEVIEAIKAHDEEQRELMKEQQEILQEIRELKTEEKDNKLNELNIEAKKIAVENIAKIANVAIQSLSAADNVDNKKDKSIDTKAVQEIAKKAVESIVAINEISEKPKIETPKANIPSDEHKLDAQPVNLLSNKIQTDVEKRVEAKLNEIAEQKKIFAQNAANNVETNAQVVPKAVNDDNKVNNVEIPKHSHSVDEPQSYKAGEDAQLTDLNKIAPKIPISPDVPIAIAMSDNSKIAQQNMAKKQEESAAVQNKENDAHLREKREAIDCNNHFTLESKNREICKTLNKANSDEAILPNIDLNSVLDLNKVDTLVQRRSLKSVKDDDRRF